MQVDHDEARKIAEADDPWIYTDPVGKLAAAYLDLLSRVDSVCKTVRCSVDERYAINALRSCLKGSSDAS